MDINDELRDMLADIFPVSIGIRNPKTGKSVRFDLTRHENKYLYFRHPGSSYQYCYTPHADADGWYYSFIYQPVGKGARTGKATRWTLKKLRPHRVRKAAKARALKLSQKESQ